MSFVESTETVAVFALARRVPWASVLYAFQFVALAPEGISIFIALGVIYFFILGTIYGYVGFLGVM